MRKGGWQRKCGEKDFASDGFEAMGGTGGNVTCEGVETKLPPLGRCQGAPSDRGCRVPPGAVLIFSLSKGKLKN